jgi:hypothetical protein
MPNCVSGAVQGGCGAFPMTGHPEHALTGTGIPIASLSPTHCDVPPICLLDLSLSLMLVPAGNSAGCCEQTGFTASLRLSVPARPPYGPDLPELRSESARLGWRSVRRGGGPSPGTPRSRYAPVTVAGRPQAALLVQLEPESRRPHGASVALPVAFVVCLSGCLFHAMYASTWGARCGRGRCPSHGCTLPTTPY